MKVNVDFHIPKFSNVMKNLGKCTHIPIGNISILGEKKLRVFRICSKELVQNVLDKTEMSYMHLKYI